LAWRNAPTLVRLDALTSWQFSDDLAAKKDDFHVKNTTVPKSVSLLLLTLI